MRSNFKQEQRTKFLMNILELARKTGLVPEEPKNDWDSLLKTLGTYGSPQARRLYDRINKKYNIPKVEEVIKKGNKTMSDEQTPVVTPEAPVTETPEETTPTVS
jgi:hypothetical protein